MEYHCYLCNHSEYRTLKGSVRDNPNLLIFKCTNCGLVVLSSFEHIKSGHYENSGMHGTTPPDISCWSKESEQDDQRRLEMLMPLLVNRRVLDFGCGAAGFIFKAKDIASEVVGIEIESHVLAHWKDKINLYGCLDDAGGEYDLITAFHVLEHFTDPRSILKELVLHLKQNGLLVIEVPNSEDALLTLYDCNDFQHFCYWSNHLFLFNAETLKSLALQAGLRVISIKQFQRYPLSNHLHWLRHGRPGGHQIWSFINSPALNEAYESSLAAIGMCDTLIAFLKPMSFGA